MSRPQGVSCPECGRQVAGAGMKLCPFCGYPLMLDRPPPVEETPHKIVHKPVDPADGMPSRTGQMQRPGPMPGYGPPPPPGYGYGAPQPPVPTQWAPPPRAQALGPHCSACHHVNPPSRKRCEICGQELWPGAAAPERWMPDPPAIPPARPRRMWWKTALAIGIPLALLGTVWTLALLL